MKVIITSGGTRVPIDDVRHISNMSTGRFACNIAKDLLRNGHEVLYLHAKDAYKPSELRLDLNRTPYIAEEYMEYTSYKDRLQEISFEDLDDYYNKCMLLPREFKAEVFVSAAAVSDYSVVRKEGKATHTTLELVKTQKVLKEVYDKYHNEMWIVGFKLLSNDTFVNLLEASTKVLEYADLVIANDLSTIKIGKHIVHSVMKKDGKYPYQTYYESPELAIVDFVAVLEEYKKDEYSYCRDWKCSWD